MFVLIEIFIWFYIVLESTLNDAKSVSSTTSSSLPVGQYPSVAVLYNENKLFFVYNSAQGLASILCNDFPCDYDYQTHTVISCNDKLYSSAVEVPPYSGNLTYNILVGHTSSTKSSMSYVSFINCFDETCSDHEILAIDSCSDQETEETDAECDYLGASVSLTYNTNDYPMFIYSKYHYSTDTTDTKSQYMLNLVICFDVLCHKREITQSIPITSLSSMNGLGKSTASLILGKNNLPSIAYASTINDSTVIGVNESSMANLNLANCLNWNCTQLSSIQSIAFNIGSNVAMQPFHSWTKNYSQAITFIDNTQTRLYLLYCINVNCTQNKLKLLSNGTVSSYPQMQLDVQDRPVLSFFQKTSEVNVMHCGTTSCEKADSQIKTVYKDANFVTKYMQVTVVPYTQFNFVVFSEVISNISQVYNGVSYIYCTNWDCTFNMYQSLDDNTSSNKFDVKWNLDIFLITIGIISYCLLFAAWIINKFANLNDFIAKNIRNAYLQQVSLDPRIRPMSYWIFFAVLISCAMGIVPWFAYFDFEISLYLPMLLPLFGPIIGALLFVILLHCDTYKHISVLLLFLTLILFVAEIGLAYSFTLVWSLNSTDCSVADLSGLRTVILVGHLIALLLVLWIQLWCIRCYRALSFARPEKLRSTSYNNQNFPFIPSGGHPRVPVQSQLLPKTSTSSKLLKHLDSNSQHRQMG